MFSGLFGGGGSAKRAAQAAADKAAESRDFIKSEAERFGEYYDPYRQAGQQAIGGQQAALGDVSSRIGALDPRMEALREQQAALQPQVSEMYTLAQQQDPILAKIQSGDMEAYQRTPGYEFRREEGARAIEQSAAARGGLFSGQTGKELERYGQGVATSEYDRYISGLYNQLSAVGTQMGGRQAALGAGQQQVNAGINLLDQDFRQIAAQMGVSDAYQNLISQGLSASDAAAKLGMNAANVQGALTKGIGETYAGGMIEKDRQMKASGDYWLNQYEKAGETAATVASGGMYQGGGGGSANFAGQISNPYSSRSALPTNATGGQFQSGSLSPQYMGAQQQPWQIQNPQQQAALRTASSFNRRVA